MLGALPFLVLFFEFSQEIEGCGREGWYYARFYSHFFLYPITFGLISTCFLARPWICGMRYLCYTWYHEKLTAIVISIISIFIIVAACINDFSTKSAIWSFPPETLTVSDTGKKIRNMFFTRCNMKSNTDDQKELDPVQKKYFLDYINELSENDELSYTHISYYIGFIAQVSLLIIIYAIFCLMIMSENNDPRIVCRLMYSLFFASFWPLMYIGFLEEKSTLYPALELPPIANLLAISVFIVPYFHIVLRFWTIFDRSLRVISLFAGILGVSGIPAILFFQKNLYSTTFGTESSLSTYVLVL